MLLFFYNYAMFVAFPNPPTFEPPHFSDVKNAKSQLTASSTSRDEKGLRDLVESIGNYLRNPRVFDPQINEILERISSINFSASDIPDSLLDTSVSNLKSAVNDLLDKLDNSETLRSDHRINQYMTRFKELCIDSDQGRAPLNVFIDAQKYIVLGTHTALDAHGDNMTGIPFLYWTSKSLNADNRDWGRIYPARIEYVISHGGSIKFLGTQITQESVDAAIQVWQDCLEENPAKDGQIEDAYAQFLARYKGAFPTTNFELAYLICGNITFEKEGFDEGIHWNELAQ